jgi:predicted phage tail protein
VLGVVVFTDIVGSTAVAEELGDRRWRELLSRHNAVARRELRRFGGREIDTAGDGFFVFFSRPVEAIRWADAVSDAVRALGVEIRAGVHAGESEVLGRKVSGMTVHIGARVLSVAGAGEILASSTVKEMIPGSGVSFVDHGVHQLKGVPGEWHLFRVSAIDGRPREVPVGEHEARERRNRIQAPVVPRRAGVLVGAGATLGVAALAAFLFTRGGDEPKSAPTTSPAPITQSIVSLDPRSPSSTTTFRLPGHPTAVAWGAGALWVTLGQEGRVIRMDPTTGKVRATFRVNAGANAVAVDDDAAWVVGASGTVSRIDVKTGALESIAVGGRLEAVVLGTDAVWVSTSEGTVSKLNPVTRRVEATFALEDIENDIRRVGLTAAPDGVWVNTSGAAGVVVNSIAWHIVSSGRQVDSGLVLLGGMGAGTGPAGVVLDGERLWAVDYAHDQLALLDPSARKLTSEYVDELGRGVFGVRKLIGVGFGNRPGYVAVDETGDPWVLNTFGHSVSHVSRLDYSVVETVEIERGPVGIAFGGGKIWVAVSRP